MLDMSLDQSMIDEGLAREAVNRIQKLRKKVRINLVIIVVDVSAFTL